MDGSRHDRRVPPGAYAGSSSEAARAAERMDALRRHGGRDVSPFARRIIGWTILALIVIGFVAALSALTGPT